MPTSGVSILHYAILFSHKNRLEHYSEAARS